jgi:CheY-like chemotaxis protein
MSMVSKARVTSDGHRHRIVCVDDETQVLEGLSLQLGRRYEVLTALSGAEALEIPQREDHISVLISYMRMPRMDVPRYWLKRAASCRTQRASC